MLNINIVPIATIMQSDTCETCTLTGTAQMLEGIRRQTKSL